MRSLNELTSPDVAAAIAARPIVVLPLGSVEQHGPHLPCGTDAMAADLVARTVAERLDALYAPFCPYGVTPLHAGHPGTVSLGRRTFELLLEDVCSELIGMGVRSVVLVNWHEGNTAAASAVATELQSRRAARLFLAQACYVAQRLYEPDGGTLTHGGGIETLAAMACDDRLVHRDRLPEAAEPSEGRAADAMRRSGEVYGFVTDVTEMAPQGWYGDPSWATPLAAADFAGRVGDEIVARLRAIGVEAAVEEDGP